MDKIVLFSFKLVVEGTDLFFSESGWYVYFTDASQPVREVKQSLW